MESALLLLLLSFILSRACLSHCCSCFHCVPTILLLSGLVSFSHLAVLFLPMSCPFQQTASLSFLHKVMLQGVPGGCAGLFGLQEGGDAQADALYLTALCSCAGVWQRSCPGHVEISPAAPGEPQGLFPCQLGCGLSSDWGQIRGLG